MGGFLPQRTCSRKFVLAHSSFRRISILMTILYFARLRDEIGCSEEKLDLPANITTLKELVVWLRTQSDGHGSALGPGSMLKMAVNQVHAEWDTSVANGDEIAFFPPVTGG